jgi:hypothetical protein
MTDYIERLKQEVAELRVIRACHTCKHERRRTLGGRYAPRWCDASAESFDHTL